MEDIYKRIGKKIDFKRLSQDICNSYELGEYRKHEFIRVGIDDLSYYLWTSKGSYIVKNFNQEKSIKEINRFIQQYEIIMKNKIKAPRLLENKGRYIFTSEIDGLYLNSCVLEFIDGKDLFTLKRLPNKEEVKQIVKLAVSLHTIPDTLEISYDPYCFLNLKNAMEECENKVEKRLVEEAKEFLQQYEKIDFTKFPTSYIHGDFISTNIMVDKQEKLWLIDFTSSGTGIRILDIVKILNSVLFCADKVEESKKMQEYFLEEYQKYLKLTPYEMETLRTLILADSYTVLFLEEAVEKEKRAEESAFWIRNDRGVIKCFS